MRVRPGKGLNSLVWLLWHMARVEDVAVNLVLTAGRQVLDDGWSSRLDVPRTDVGRGMTEDEVVDLNAVHLGEAATIRSLAGFSIAI